MWLVLESVTVLKLMDIQKKVVYGLDHRIEQLGREHLEKKMCYYNDDHIYSIRKLTGRAVGTRTLVRRSRECASGWNVQTCKRIT